MAALSAELRSTFEREVVQARDTAEGAAQAALTTLAIERDRPFESMSEEKRALRRALRARARQLGEGDMSAGIPRLIEEIAYEQWHRMLFARFLAENDLLMHPEGVAVTLGECAELAQEEGAEDLWAVATRYASLMLPGIFRLDDPALQVRFAPEGRHNLEQIVTDLPKTVFTSDDGLGWAYQFWQSKKKDEVNASERKIGGADIAPVTQLFTEDYMVKFLLHNTLGAWWAHRHPDSLLNKTFEYLRYRDDGSPAAGTFDGWPDKVAEVTMMDPCGGSGHFVVAAFEMFVLMRMEEEDLSAADAGDAVIRDNVHMLELDLRCTQIAAFNLALAAWKTGGYRQLPIPHIVCSGIPVRGQLEEWVKLAGDNYSLQTSLERLYLMFKSAPDLGSLIAPAVIPLEDRMFTRDFDHVTTLLHKLLAEGNQIGKQTLPGAGYAVVDVARAASYLAKTYDLVATNVPYLNFSKQSMVLRDFCEIEYPLSKRDLATVFLERCRRFTTRGGRSALITPQNWLFLGAYEPLRTKYLKGQTWCQAAWLGPRAFETIGGEVVKPVLLVFANSPPNRDHLMSVLDTSEKSTATEKERSLIHEKWELVEQLRQLDNPDSRVTREVLDHNQPLLIGYADSYEGIGTGDLARFSFFWWEVLYNDPDWVPLRGTTKKTNSSGGLNSVLLWQNGRGDLINLARELDSRPTRGDKAWGKQGIAVNRMGDLSAELFSGEIFDCNIAAIIPKKKGLLTAIWAFCRSEEYREAVRKIDKSLKVTNRTLLKVPFDLEYWQTIADETDQPSTQYSHDPTQWFFSGSIPDSIDPLQGSVALMLGHRWPLRVDKTQYDAIIDQDGLVCLSSVAGEQPAFERLRSVLAFTHEKDWSLAKQRQLLIDTGFKGKSLANWLQDGFFKKHCKLFLNRPFIWHIWDGRKDGFSTLVNYHKLDHAKLERLIYTYLGDWINTQRAEQEQGVAGAEGRLVAALELKKKLELILEGEPPYDIYVRWKPLHEQSIGWNPDLNDGVRLNIRPFVTARVLRNKFTVHWRKDRGKNPDGSERHNNLHFTREEKEDARRKADLLLTLPQTGIT